MAYSWLSHCKRYLELLEGEKRFLRSYKVPLNYLCLNSAFRFRRSHAVRSSIPT